MENDHTNNSYWAFLNKEQGIHWKGYCNQDRHLAIYEIENIANNHGYITDFHMYSDIEICIRIEIEERKIPSLYATLNSFLTLTRTWDLNSDSERERVILLNVTFTKGTGNLKIEVPAVPG